MAGKRIFIDVFGGEKLSVLCEDADRVKGWCLSSAVWAVSDGGDNCDEASIYFN